MLKIIIVAMVALVLAISCRANKTVMETIEMKKPHTASEISNPEDLWRGYDPRKEPLEEEIIRQWSEDGCHYKEVFFTGETFEGEKVRVYGIYGAPDSGKNLPGVLHVHGGGQTVNLGWLKWWNSRGYAAMTFNWGGQWSDGRKYYTHWGEKLKNCNHEKSQTLFAGDPTPKLNPWYHWTLVSRRALTYLETQPEVDPNRLGAYGISMGGTIMWPFAASDKRLKAVCPIYGNGWDTYRWEQRFDLAGKAAPADHSTLIFRQTVEPQANAPYVTCPVLFLSPTNDFHGHMDRSFQTIGMLPKKTDWRAATTPHFNHHVGPAEGANLGPWMDHYLLDGPALPKTPSAKVSLGKDGVPILTVKPDRSQEIEKVEVYYGLKEPVPPQRFWRMVEPKSVGKSWVAPLPVLNTDDYLFAFANVHYKGGKTPICLSSSLEALIPNTLGEARATDSPSLIIDDGSNGARDWSTNSPGTDPIPPVPVPLCDAIGPDGKKGFGLTTPTFSPCTWKIGDPKWIGPQGATLCFKVKTTAPNVFEVRLEEGMFSRPNAATYGAKVTLAAGDGWQQVKLSAGDFKNVKDQSAFPGWQSARLLQIQAPEGGWKGENPKFTEFEWANQ